MLISGGLNVFFSIAMAHNIDLHTLKSKILELEDSSRKHMVILSENQELLQKQITGLETKISKLEEITQELQQGDSGGQKTKSMAQVVQEAYQNSNLIMLSLTHMIMNQKSQGSLPSHSIPFHAQITELSKANLTTGFPGLQDLPSIPGQVFESTGQSPIPYPPLHGFYDEGQVYSKGNPPYHWPQAYEKDGDSNSSD